MDLLRHCKDPAGRDQVHRPSSSRISNAILVQRVAAEQLLGLVVMVLATAPEGQQCHERAPDAPVGGRGKDMGEAWTPALGEAALAESEYRLVPVV